MQYIIIAPGHPPFYTKWFEPENHYTDGLIVIDTINHLGSGYSAIAAHSMGFDFVCCELDKDYYDSAVKRYNNAIMQQSLL